MLQWVKICGDIGVGWMSFACGMDINGGVRGQTVLGWTVSSWNSCKPNLRKWLYLEIGFCRCNQVMMRSSWIRVGLNPMTVAFIRKGKCHMTQTHRGELYVKTDRDGKDIKDCQPPPEARREVWRSLPQSPLEPINLDFRLSAFRTVKESISLLSPPVWGTYIQRLQETNAD